MHFLVTGGSGFVGGNLARLLTSRGHTVTALVRRSSNRKELEKLPGVRFVYGDIATGEGMDEALEGVDCVQHVAGVTKARTPEEFHQGNAEGTRLLCQAISRQTKVPRLVYCSSLAAAGPATVGKPRRESDEAAPVSIYGRSKLSAELAVRQFADRVPSVIVRPPFVYGPGDITNVPPFLVMGRLGLYFKPGLGPKHFSFIHVEDLTEALLAAATKGKTLGADPGAGVYFVADPSQYSWEDFFRTLSAAMGKGQPRVLPLPDILSDLTGLGSELVGRLTGKVPIVSRDKARESRCEAWTCSVDLAAREMDFSAAFPLAKGLEHTVAWYRKEGRI
ncbi:MAG: NAD-dependent epimerase/dehydratase family protein [Myxococcaceae bacterium]